MALSGTSYENLFKGNYEEAKSNGNDRTKWIKAETNADGKLEFRIPVAADETYLPLVSISNTYLAKFEAGENPIERAFYPRQMVIDREAKTLVVGDYEFSKELEIVNNVKMFKPESATLTTIGGPNSNNYAAILDLVMGSDSFDKAFIGTKDEAAAAKEGVVSLENRTFSFKLKWVVKAGEPDSVVDLMKDTIIVCIPASCKRTHDRRFKAFSQMVCEKCGAVNGFDFIQVYGRRQKAHIDHVHALAEDTDKYIHIDESRFKGKRVIIIDDIVTTCKTANAFVDRMITAGADVRMVLFLGMTKYFKRYND